MNDFEKIDRQLKHYREHPELYCTTEEVAELTKMLNDKFGFERPKVIDTTPVLVACPHCQKELPIAPNIRFWKPQEMRAYADVVEGIQQQAAANRAASLEAQTEPLTETV